MRPGTILAAVMLAFMVVQGVIALYLVRLGRPN